MQPASLAGEDTAVTETERLIAYEWIMSQVNPSWHIYE